MAALPLIPIAVGLMAAGTVVSAVGAIRQSQAAAGAAEFNAEMARRNAGIAEAQGNAAAEAQQRDSQRRIGAAIATYGASGVDVGSGSPADVLADSARQASLDNATIKYNAKLRALGLEAQAGLDTANAANARAAGPVTATGTMLSGFGQAAGTYGLGSGTSIPKMT